MICKALSKYIRRDGPCSEEFTKDRQTALDVESGKGNKNKIHYSPRSRNRFLTRLKCGGARGLADEFGEADPCTWTMWNKAEK